MLLMISWPSALVSMYFSFTLASGWPRCSASDTASSCVTFIISDLQQLPHCVQSICGVTSILIACTMLSITPLSCCFKKRRKASFSLSFTAAIALICSRSFSSGKGQFLVLMNFLKHNRQIFYVILFISNIQLLFYEACRGTLFLFCKDSYKPFKDQ